MRRVAVGVGEERHVADAGVQGVAGELDAAGLQGGAGLRDVVDVEGERVLRFGAKGKPNFSATTTLKRDGVRLELREVAVRGYTERSRPSVLP